MKSNDKNRTIKPHSRMDEIHNQMAMLKERIKRKKEIIADHFISLSFNPFVHVENVSSFCEVREVALGKNVLRNHEAIYFRRFKISGF